MAERQPSAAALLYFVSMAISLLQKIRLAWRGWNRRRDQANAEFLAKNTWNAGVPPAGPAPSTAPRRQTTIDRDGLQVAYLDDSGAIEHYLDIESGDVIEFPVSSPLCDITQNPSRFKKVPTRTAQSEAEDRRAFLQALEPSRTRDLLNVATDAAEFRRVISGDRAVERAWYNFKNDRANAAISAWLRSIGAA